MEILYPELALCGRENECAKTDTVFFPISEVNEETVSLRQPLLSKSFFLPKKNIDVKKNQAISQAKKKINPKITLVLIKKKYIFFFF